MHDDDGGSTGYAMGKQYDDDEKNYEEQKDTHYTSIEEELKSVRPFLCMA